MAQPNTRPILDDATLDGVVSTPSPRRGFPLPDRDRLLSLALAALSSRSLVWLATLGGGGLWGYAVLHPEPLRLVAATGYSVTLLFPILWHARVG